ncbi:MAG: homogentisate 1,2-dioxygenase, partial [Salibacteraceae bacterium]
MPFYHKLGKIPPKRHTQFRKDDGSLYQEQLFGTVGFDGMSSNLYHEHAPTRVTSVSDPLVVKPEAAVENNMTSRMLQGWKVKPEQDFMKSRVPVLFNNDVQIILSAPTQSLTEYFYKNADSDEMIFIHKGSGKLRTHLGNIDFKYGDYLI